MKRTKTAVAVFLSSLIATQPMLLQVAYAAQGGTQDPMSAQLAQVTTPDLMPRALTGFYDDQTAAMNADRIAAQREMVAAGLGEDGSPAARSPMAGLPILDTALQAKAANVRGDEVLRLLVHLSYLPHAQVFQDVIEQHRDSMELLEKDRIEFLAGQDAKRDRTAKVDADNYVAVSRNTDAEKAQMRALSERNEALSGVIKRETITRLKTLIDDNQAGVIEEITALGGNVEFTTIAGNIIVATLPAEKVEDVAKIEGVMRVLEDSMMEGHLNVADAATMVDPADTSLLGLWDNGFDGGIYDPAIIDSGVDQAHPGMANSAVPLRDNFCSWYLVAGVGSANFADAFTCDDLQGHGTHVAGIVASKGSSGFLNYRGMAAGVEKTVNLKAGWLNSSNGRASMFWSDKYNLVDRALNSTDNLIPGSAFADDVDGFNLSYGGDTTLNDTDGGRFWDSVIATYSDTPVTISAGNSGPNNTLFSDPAVSYNAITVANFNDRGSATRVDDIINAGSTVGPTANGRKKPDIAAPGTSILAPNHNWEGGSSDYVSKTGTSMAAPMVLGVIMDLMDAAVFDELALKALLINTAQKNLPGMNIEGDFDGWDPQIGWGAMNAYAAYFHRFDVFRDFLDPRDVADNHESNDYRLYKGTMRDEGASGEGRDRATMVWNREATYLATSTPDNYFTLTDMNLRLYRESNNVVIDSELGVVDNVHQVRINAGASDTDVVVKAYTWSSAFAHGNATEEIAVATEDGFVRVDFPIDFQGIAVWPSEVEPNEVFDITFWLRNDSDIASHNNNFNLSLPAGWTLISGTDSQNVGSAAAGGITSEVVYTLRAPPSPAVGAQTITVAHSHSSYLESYGNFNWNMNLTVAVDNTAPNPNPMSFSTLPDDASMNSIDMVAQFASDIHNPVEYYLDYASSPSGGVGGTDSGWQTSRTYVDAGLGVNHNYCYRAWARDNANFPNLTTPSADACAYTAQQTPSGVAFGAVTTTSIAVASSNAPPNLTLGASGLRTRNATTGDNGPWQQAIGLWTSVGLTPATKYEFAAQARNGDGDMTGNSSTDTRYTLANPPAVNSLTTVSASSINVALNPNGNSPQAEYLIQNTTAGTSSGWQNNTSWSSGGLECDTPHNFQARARNGDNIETIIVAIGSQTTGACVSDLDGDGVVDGSDNCTAVPNADQRDTNGDGFGNICDADFNNDGITNVVDLGILRSSFFVPGDLDTDMNGDGITNVVDLGLLRSMFFLPPGPSGVAP